MSRFFPGEASCLSLGWAALDLLLDDTRRLGFSELDYSQVVQIKRQLGADELTKVA